VHECDSRQCPIACQLCTRLCQDSHLHGLEERTVHLCGCVSIICVGATSRILPNREEHECRALCTASGVCEINTAPQSIEATFTGRNETFQYTKVRILFRARLKPLIVPSIHKVTRPSSAVSKLIILAFSVANQKRCAKIIKPGKTAHSGRHLHGPEDKVFHYCNARSAL